MILNALVEKLKHRSKDDFKGRHFEASLILQAVSSSRMGERTLRRLLIIGASGVVRWARRKGVPAGSWLARMLARKPPMLVIVALANKMARIAWALIAKGGSYRAPAVAA